MVYPILVTAALNIFSYLATLKFPSSQDPVLWIHSLLCITSLKQLFKKLEFGDDSTNLKTGILYKSIWDF